jgi:hypothetical protein
MRRAISGRKIQQLRCKCGPNRSSGAGRERHFLGAQFFNQIGGLLAENDWPTSTDFVT